MSLDPAGERDWLAPPVNARRNYQEAQPPQKALLIAPGAGHNTTYKAAPQQYESQVVGFLEKTLPRGSSPRG